MKKLFAATALALCLIGGAVTTAQADGRDHRHERRDDNRAHKKHDDRHKHEDRRKHSRDWDHRDSYRPGYVHGRHDHKRYHRSRYVRPSGYYHRAWRHGDRLPRAYYSHRYIVHDYHVYRLRPPPRGHYWVRVDNDVLLTAVATGLVVHALHDIFY